MMLAVWAFGLLSFIVLGGALCAEEPWPYAALFVIWYLPFLDVVKIEQRRAEWLGPVWSRHD